ncbi:MAG: hypothetical protein PVH64_08670 [Bacillota bacterium]|jgi:hypothetical protein
MKKNLLVTLALLLLTVTVTIAVNAAENRLSGKDFVQLGKPGTVSGSLLEKEGEWYLKTPAGAFNLHFGNHDYRAKTGIQLKTDKIAVVKGFIYGKDIAVSAITLDQKNYQFRRDDGNPLWAGNGNNRNNH